MKINAKRFLLREIMDEFIVMPIGEYADREHNILSLNATGAFLWKQLENPQTEETLVEALLGKYDVDAETARSAVKSFLASVNEIGCLED